MSTPIATRKLTMVVMAQPLGGCGGFRYYFPGRGQHRGGSLPGRRTLVDPDPGRTVCERWPGRSVLALHSG